MRDFLKESGQKNPKPKNYSTSLPCLVCGLHTEGGSALHHVKTRKSGGSDHHSNLMPLCFVHHTQVHMVGLSSFAERFHTVKTWLVSNGWEFNEFYKKWVHCA